MAKTQTMLQAHRLRKGGYSIGSIASKLNVSKSTVSNWCRDISLTEKQLKIIAERSKHHATISLLRASEVQREERQMAIVSATRDGFNEVGVLSRRDIFMVGLGLYWGEGYKKGSQELGFTNSDPAMVLFYISWLHKVYGINKANLILRVAINERYKERIGEILHYWSELTSIPVAQFTKTSLIRAKIKKKYENTANHFGTLRIKVRKGTALRRRILGSISALRIK